MAEAVKDVTITEEVVAVNAEAQADLEEEVQVVAEVSDQEKKADSEAKEAQLQEKVVSEATEIQLLLKEKAVSEVQLQEPKEVQTELQDVLKALVIHQDQEDQEETNKSIS